jgi:hypothetical protein
MSYVQLDRTLPVESVELIVSLPEGELPLKVNVVEIVEVKPPTAKVQFVETVHVEELTFVAQPAPPSAGLEPLSPEMVSLPLIVMV